ncbi:MAG: DUF2975 domain-containing protein [Pseudomonadota bacterium]
MTRPLSRLISWGCSLAIALQVLAGLYGLLNIEAFVALAREQLTLPIQWQTVAPWQGYLLFAATVACALPGLAALYFLRRPFSNFARGELFNAANSRALRRFAALLLLHALLRPVHTAIASVVLSLNHPAGEKMLSLTFGSDELSAVGLALVFWVLSNLLLEGSRLHAENRQFV